MFAAPTAVIKERFDSRAKSRSIEFSSFGTIGAFISPSCGAGNQTVSEIKGRIMLRKSFFGLLAVVGLVTMTAGTASANPYGYGYGYGHGHHHHHRPYYGGYRPPVYVAPPVPVYGPPVVGGYGCRPGYGNGYGYGPGYGYGQPGVGVTTPGFGFYVR